ncbi:exosortase V [uncultured Croceicoccus sp.]|uniref:exosortase V n=1 Tax=uncultured Croceicoccus sp. TaxID=1295329 RepID=UPI00260C521D|nr:exosortase V [uncultured Croceicoccus sp.]
MTSEAIPAEVGFEACIMDIDVDGLSKGHETRPSDATAARNDTFQRASGATAFASIGLLAFAVPTFIRVAKEHWTTESGVHGPIILATGLWLIWREREWITAHRIVHDGWLWILPFLTLSSLWLLARMFQIVSVESAALYLLLVGSGWLYFGAAVVKRLWFPILYLAFMVVLPASVVDQVTQPLKLWISFAAASLLDLTGYPVASTGAIIQIGQYQLLVEDACAGLMSLFSLSAIGLFYVYLVAGNDSRRAVILMAAILPMAVLSNLVRVIVLALLTYHAGSKAAQGFMHDMAGLLTFSVSLAGMFAADAVVARTVLSKPAQT